MSKQDISNEFTVDNTTRTKFKSLRLKPLRKSTFLRTFQLNHGTYLNQHLLPVVRDESFPSRLRKARKPYWLELSAYGTNKPYDEVENRLLGNAWVSQRCKSLIIQQALAAEHNIVPADPEDYTNETARLVNIQKTFMKSVNREGSTFKKFLEPLLDDLIDQGTCIGIKGFHKDAYIPIHNEEVYEQTFPESYNWTYVPNNLGAGYLREITAQDETGFFAQVDEFGNVIGWWQRLNQGTPVYFSRREMVVMKLNPNTYSPYGIGAVVLAKSLINSIVIANANTEQYMEDGAIPPAVVLLSEISKTDFDAFVDRWEATVEGNPNEIPVLSAGEGKFQYQPLVTNTNDIMQLDMIENFGRAIMTVYKVTPNELGMTDTVNRSTAEQQAVVQNRISTFPMNELIVDMYNTQIKPEFDPRNKTKFVIKEPKGIQEKKEEWEFYNSKLQAGVMTVNQYLQEIGEPTVPWGEYLFDKNSWVNYAMQNDATLLGFAPEQTGDQAKLEFYERQIPMLLQSIVMSLQTDKELDATTISLLTRLQAMQSASDNKGRLGIPSASVVEMENLVDNMNMDLSFRTTADIFNDFPMVSTKALSSIGGIFSSEEETFWRVKNKIFGDKAERTFQRRRDQAHEPIEELIINTIEKHLKNWQGKIDELAKFLLKPFEGMTIFSSQANKLADQVVEYSMSEKALKDELKEVIYEALTMGSSMNNDALVRNRGFNVEDYDQYLRDYIDQRTELVVESIVKDVSKNIKYDIVEGFKKGESINAIARRVKEYTTLTPARAKAIARTETNAASNMGRLRQLKEMGADKWEYHTHIDERNNQKDKFGNYIDPCPDMHRKQYKLDDVRFLPPLHVNCRCSIHGIYSSLKYIDVETSEDIVAKSVSKNRDLIFKAVGDLQPLTAFRMIRENDETGISGTGHVATGFIYENGRTVLNWHSDKSSVIIFDSYNDFLDIHVNSHPTNKTRIEPSTVSFPLLKALDAGLEFGQPDNPNKIDNRKEPFETAQVSVAAGQLSIKDYINISPVEIIKIRAAARGYETGEPLPLKEIKFLTKIIPQLITQTYQAILGAQNKKEKTFLYTYLRMFEDLVEAIESEIPLQKSIRKASRTWEDYSYNEQQAYLEQHPATERTITATEVTGRSFEEEYEERAVKKPSLAERLASIPSYIVESLRNAGKPTLDINDYMFEGEGMEHLEENKEWVKEMTDSDTFSYKVDQDNLRDMFGNYELVTTGVFKLNNLVRGGMLGPREELRVLGHLENLVNLRLDMLPNVSREMLKSEEGQDDEPIEAIGLDEMDEYIGDDTEGFVKDDVKEARESLKELGESQLEGRDLKRFKQDVANANTQRAIDKITKYYEINKPRNRPKVNPEEPKNPDLDATGVLGRTIEKASVSRLPNELQEITTDIIDVVNDHAQEFEDKHGLGSCQPVAFLLAQKYKEKGFDAKLMFSLYQDSSREWEEEDGIPHFVVQLNNKTIVDPTNFFEDDLDVVVRSSERRWDKYTDMDEIKEDDFNQIQPMMYRDDELNFWKDKLENKEEKE